MIWMLLQILKIIKASVLLHQDGEVVVSILILEVLLSTVKSVLKTFEGNCKHSHVINLQDAAQCEDKSLLDQDIELLGIGRGGAVAQSPDCFVLDAEVVMLKNLDQLFYDACVDAKLELLLGAGSNV